MSSYKKYHKVLTANDVGKTNAHQGGICIPKTGQSPMHILPYLDPSIKNPYVWINCRDQNSNIWSFRYIYYNSKLHPSVNEKTGKYQGTRNEYRITHLTKYLKANCAKVGDVFEISKRLNFYEINLIKKSRSSDLKIVLRGWSTVC
jgi:hypothetical protein